MITPELIKFIKNSIAAGETKEMIVAQLLPQGWTQNDIDEAFRNITDVPQIQQIKATIPNQELTYSTQTKDIVKRSFAGNLKMYAPSMVRYAMSLVILWFGVQQFMDTSSWLAYVPDSAVSLTHLSATTLVYINGTIEVVFGTLLIFGWKTRWVALILALHLFDIMYIVGYGEIGVRDFGLAMTTFTIFMNGPDILSLDAPHHVNNTK